MTDTLEFPKKAMPSHKPARLKNLRISEVSSVDRGAGADCRVVFSKKRDDIPDQITKAMYALEESVASIIDDDEIDKSDALIETMGQAHDYFSKLFADPTDGADMADVADHIEKGTTMPTPNAYDMLMAKAAELRQGDPKLTEAKAFAKVYEMPGNRQLVEASKAEHAERMSGTTVEKVDHASAGDRLARCAAALARQHPDLSHAQAFQHAKDRNPDLARAYAAETGVAA
jgi:hypothetical protein